MAVVEDAASVLEQFVQDVANLPAEIAHLLEEIEAKDKVIQDCRSIIHTRDSSIQKYLKANGAGHANPKEDAYGKVILSNFDRAKQIQDEKVGLSEKASILLDRQIRRLDASIRTLQTEGLIAPDPLLPSLLSNTPHPTPRFPSSLSTTGTTTPLHPIPANIAANPNTSTTTTPAPGPSTTIAHSSLARLVQQQHQQQPAAAAAAAAAAAPPPAHTTSHRHPSPVTANLPPTPTITVQHPTARESSLDSKRRRLNNLPTASSSLRQSSLGPGTPKAGTPSASGGHAGSAGPKAAAANKKPVKGGLAPHQRLAHLNPAVKKGASARRKGTRKGLSGLKSSHSDTGDESALSEVDGSESEAVGAGDGSAARGTAVSGKGDVEMGGMEEDEEVEGDDRKYCTCRSVSYGNMVACDNEECAYEWFHWSCVGMTREPAGKWYCEECRVKLGIKG